MFQKDQNFEMYFLGQHPWPKREKSLFCQTNFTVEQMCCLVILGLETKLTN
jgi:hypothetical protein